MSPVEPSAGESPRAGHSGSHRFFVTLLAYLALVYAGSIPVAPSAAQAAQPPEVAVDEPTSVTQSTAEIRGSVNPMGDLSTFWWVQLSTAPDCATEYTNLESHALESAANIPISVHEELSGLLPSQHYCVRIAATNGGGTTISSPREFSTAPASPPMQVFTAFASLRTATSVRLNGWANPVGANSTYPMTYRFEYSGDGGSTWTSLPDHQYDGGAREQIVFGVDLTGLDPGQGYLYRFEAWNSLGQAAPQGFERAFTTRAYEPAAQPARRLELVNAPDKGNQHVVVPSTRGVNVLAENGDSAVWGVSGGAPGGNAPFGNVFLAKRTDTGWVSRSLIPPLEQQISTEGDQEYRLQATTPDLTTFAFTVTAPKISPATTLALIDDRGTQTVLRQYPTEPGAEYLDLSNDGAHVLLVGSSPSQLEDLTAQGARVVSVMPDGQPNACGLFSGDGLVGVQRKPGYHLMGLEDASRVYFQAIENGTSCTFPGPLGLYRRNTETGDTALIDPGASGRSPELVRASADGRRLYFVTWSALDPSDGNSDADVYRWGDPSQEFTCITCVVPDAQLATNPARALHVLVSDDGSHVYFESTKQLLPGMGTAGHGNLYVVGPRGLDFVADVESSPGYSEGFLRPPAVFLSSDGNTLVFAFSGTPTEHRRLTADAVAPKCTIPAQGQYSCSELYRYDDRDQSIECVSCNRQGETVSSVVTPTVFLGSKDFRVSRDGGTVAFATPGKLVPSDVNKGVDIYEWHDGAQRLVTDGVGNFQQTEYAAPQVHAVSADGRDILFSVVAPGATGFEQDGLANLYDARIGGGFDLPPPATPCVGESCQGEIAPAPGLARPGSSSIERKGNSGRRRKRACKHRGKPRKRCARAHRKHRGGLRGR